MSKITYAMAEDSKWSQPNSLKKNRRRKANTTGVGTHPLPGSSMAAAEAETLPLPQRTGQIPVLVHEAESGKDEVLRTKLATTELSGVKMDKNDTNTNERNASSGSQLFHPNLNGEAQGKAQPERQQNNASLEYVFGNNGFQGQTNPSVKNLNATLKTKKSHLSPKRLSKGLPSPYGGTESPKNSYSYYIPPSSSNYSNDDNQSVQHSIAADSLAYSEDGSLMYNSGGGAAYRGGVSSRSVITSDDASLCFSIDTDAESVRSSSQHQAYRGLTTPTRKQQRDMTGRIGTLHEEPTEDDDDDDTLLADENPYFSEQPSEPIIASRNKPQQHGNKSTNARRTSRSISGDNDSTSFSRQSHHHSSSSLPVISPGAAEAKQERNSSRRHSRKGNDSPALAATDSKLVSSNNTPRSGSSNEPASIKKMKASANQNKRGSGSSRANHALVPSVSDSDSSSDQEIDEGRGKQYAERQRRSQSASRRRSSTVKQHSRNSDGNTHTRRSRSTSCQRKSVIGKQGSNAGEYSNEREGKAKKDSDSMFTSSTPWWTLCGLSETLFK
jgi:hypothetical protein